MTSDDEFEQELFKIIEKQVKKRTTRTIQIGLG